MSTVVDTRYWHSVGAGRVQCDACPRACRLHDGQRGLCFVRGAESGRVRLYSYGRSSGFCVDPIEKKPLNHFLPGSAVLSFGTAGCNLACKFCQNWDMSKSREMDTLADSATPAELAAAAQRLGCASIAYTYNDPTVFLEYAVDVAQAAHERGVRSVAVTAGYMLPAPRADFFSHMDAANIDLKSFSERFYREICGAELQPVLETLEYVHSETSVWLEVTTLLIPGLNDSDAEVAALCAWVADRLGPDVPLHFTAFHPDWKLRDVPPTPLATLRRARRIGLDHGLRYVYTGNVVDREGGSTWCSGCGGQLIGRDGYDIESWNLDGAARCRRCRTVCAGVFDGAPGLRAPGRRGVRLASARERAGGA
ncbi:MAG: AmmeMemoRadiSam system radical SAM enzyme [Proteobacteria bacterium]|nr:AmmeMemoRadiSam system radical SAM enzyme [Pseudomonadota bacterium]